MLQLFFIQLDLCTVKNNYFSLVYLGMFEKVSENLFKIEFNSLQLSKRKFRCIKKFISVNINKVL